MPGTVYLIIGNEVVGVIQPSSSVLAAQSRFTSQIILAQNKRIEDINILADIQKSFDKFVSSGQVWALIIGIVIGYMFRSLTSY
jgi:hypothetical protein